MHVSQALSLPMTGNGKVMKEKLSSSVVTSDVLEKRGHKKDDDAPDAGKRGKKV